MQRAWYRAPPLKRNVGFYLNNDNTKKVQIIVGRGSNM